MNKLHSKLLITCFTATLSTAVIADGTELENQAIAHAYLQCLAVDLHEQRMAGASPTNIQMALQTCAEERKLLEAIAPKEIIDKETLKIYEAAEEKYSGSQNS